MSIVEMSAAGAVIILAAVLIRAVGKNRLPVGAFEALWALAWARLMLPVRLPFRLSAWTLVRRLAPHAAGPVATPAPAALPGSAMPEAVDIIQDAPLVTAAPAAAGTPFPTLTVLWLAGAAVCALALGLCYVRACRRFREAEPIGNDYVNRFLAEHPLRRKVSVRASERVGAPLTYGVVRPVILLPRSMDLADGQTLGYVLAHELAHIRRLDAARKLALAAAVCLHWFDPLVWLMAALAGRDMERACDRAVVDAFGPEARRDYAMALLDLEERRGGFAGLASGFSKNAIEERIHSIMKIRPRTFLSTLLAFVLVLSVGAAFATAAPEEAEDEAVIGGADGPTYIVVSDDASTVFSGDVMASSDGTVYVFTAEGKPVSMTQQEYKLLFEPVEVEWWTAEEYAAWLEQEKIDLQDCLGQRAWTSADGWFTWTQEKIDETIEMYEQVLAEIEDGLLVSKTVDGRADVSLMQGNGDTLYSSEDGIVMFRYDEADASPSDLYRGYSYIFIDGDDRTTIGPFDTPEQLLEALEDEVDARVADGRLSEEAARELLENFDPAPGTEQVFSPGGKVTYSFNGSESMELTDDEQAALDVLLENQQLRAALGVTTDEELYSTQTVFAGELQDALEELDDALEPYLPFGLQYSYDVPTGELTMTWNGREVRGLYDSTAGVWITAHSGDGTWPEGTPELVAVYSDGELAGLRLATEEEQAQWDRLRESAGISGSADFAVPPAEEAQPEWTDGGWTFHIMTEDKADAMQEQNEAVAEERQHLTERLDQLDQERAEIEQKLASMGEAEEEQRTAGTTTVPSSKNVTVFFQQTGGAPYGEIEAGSRVRLADDIHAAAGNTVAMSLTTRTDASLTVSLRSGTDSMDQSVDLEAGEPQTVTFSPEEDGTYELYLINDGEYPVEFIASRVVS